jgi:hypothetical protein
MYTASGTPSQATMDTCTSLRVCHLQTPLQATINTHADHRFEALRSPIANKSDKHRCDCKDFNFVISKFGYFMDRLKGIGFDAQKRLPRHETENGVISSRSAC